MRDCFGYLAIHFATPFGHLVVAKLIANKHPKVLTEKDWNRYTPLKIARLWNKQSVVNWLINEKGVTE